MKGMRAVAAAASLFIASQASSQQLFDWGSDPITGPVPPANYTPAPFLKEGPSNGAAVASYLAGQPVKALKIDAKNFPSPATIQQVFGTQNVKYTFVDYEGPNAVASFSALAAQIKASAGTGPSASSVPPTSYIGNFDLAPIVSDPSRASGVIVPTYNEYIASGATMANEALYPGTASFKAPGQIPGGTSSSPNIRSALFALPIVRASIVSASLPAGHQHIPYVTRFNNQAAGMTNGTFNLDGVTRTAFYFDDQHGTANQLLSRGDMSALIAHYRARGVNGVHALDGGVVGYTKQQFNDDVASGWHFAPFETILNGGGAKSATLDTVAKVDGTVKNIEDSGVVFSGVYSLTQAGGAGKLALLVSNLDEGSHELSFPNKIGGKSIPGSITIPGGQHKLLDFTGAGTAWTLNNPGGTRVFIDDARNGVGVPEPTMIGGLGLLACFGLGRRRTKTA